MLEHPVRTGLYRAHATPVRTGPTYPVRTGLPGWPAEIASSAPLLLLRPKAIYSVPRTMFRVSKVLDEILVSFAPLPSLFEDQEPIGKNP